MRRVRGRVGLGGAEEGEQEQEHASLRSRPHPALRATFSRCAGEGLSVMPRDEIGLEALLPFTGEGARRADEGASAASRSCSPESLRHALAGSIASQACITLRPGIAIDRKSTRLN